MFIFIDESGTFTPVAQGKHSISAVGALIIPEQKYPLLLRRYERLRHSLPKNQRGEVKGSRLREDQVAAVCDLLRKNSCIFEIVALDMGIEDVAKIEAHRAGQAEGLTKHLDERYYQSLIDQVWALRRTLEIMPLQLYIQTAVMSELLAKVLIHAPLYYVQRNPAEILNYRWVVDGKEVNKLTLAEDWWSKTMMATLQSKSRASPMLMLEGADYSAFRQKFEKPMPSYLVEFGFKDEPSIDIKKIMTESFRFSSDAEPGLELVDIVTNATRRALQGSLGRDGWSGIPRLMIHQRGQYINLISLSGADADLLPKPLYADVIVNGFARTGRPMIPPSGRD